MPLYDYKCPTCNRKREVMLKLEDLHKTVSCLHCDTAMNRLVSAPYVVGDYAPYECPVTGRMIEGRRAHEENLKRTGCRILEPGEAQAHSRRLEREEAAFEASIDETADRLISELPTEKRDRLAAEMEGGLTTTLERSTPVQAS
jgi:putative FmdB family regulatory protein